MAKPLYATSGLMTLQFQEGCTVIDELEGEPWSVIRCDQDGLVLLEPSPPVGGDGSGPTHSAKRRGTRWAFHKDVRGEQARTVSTETPRSSIAAISALPTFYSSTSNPSACPAVPGPDGFDRVKPPPASSNPTSYARRAAKLDKRFVFRPDSDNRKRGRGLFAARDVPKGTEVMRVRAMGVVASRGRSAGVCCRCFVQQKRSRRLKACRGCGLRFCADCSKTSADDGIHKTVCDFAAGVLRLCSADRQAGHDEAVLRLAAEILARKEEGLIDDEEWDLLGSLESGDNASGTIGLSSSLLEDCVQLFGETLHIEVSKGDLQNMYRRLTRNLHTVTPAVDDVGSGTAQVLSTCGALVNHSCKPNAFFHCVSRPSSLDGPVVENVLRTIFPVKAGEELCVSYITDFAAGAVSERRRLLQGWGFWCACSRCKDEAGEEERREGNARLGDAKAASCIGKLEGVLELFAQNRAGDIGGATQFEQLEQAIQFYTEEGERIAPALRRRLILSAMHLMLLMDGVSGVLKFVTLQAAGDELMELGDPGTIDLRYKLYKEALELSGVKPFFERAARKALAEAIALSELMYGKQHPRSQELRKELEIL